MDLKKNIHKFLVISVVVCIAISAASRSTSADEGTAESLDSISKQIGEIFAKADKLAAERQKCSGKYLMSLRNDELARLYMPVPVQKGIPFDTALKAVKKDRQKIIEQFLKYGSPLDEHNDRDFRNKYAKLVDELAALGPQAVPKISMRMGDDYRRTGHWAMAKKALLKIGPAAVEPLMLLMHSRDSYLRANVAYVLCGISDPRAKDTLLRAVLDESGSVRHWAVQGLVRLGPDVIGKDKLITLLIDQLNDGVCLYESIQGLERYGDESAIEALRVVEQFHPGRGKADMRYHAMLASNAILRRTGKDVKQVRREEYDTGRSSYDDLKTAAVCPNVGIRRSAIGWLDRYKDEQTAVFLIELWVEEQNPLVLDQIARTLHILMIPLKGSSKSPISAPVMQKAFDTFLSVPETKPVLSDAILLACKRSARIHDFIPPAGNKVLAAAISGARGVVYTASNSEINLERIDRFKRLVRELGLSSEDQSLRIACYSAVTSIARLSHETAATWLPQEKDELQRQLAPLLDSPNPNIRLIECLGYIGDKRLTIRLIELLGHDDPSIRRFAAHALGQIGDLRALPALKHLAETDPHQYENGVYGVRKAASEAIDLIISGENGPTKTPLEESSSKRAAREQDVNGQIKNLLSKLEDLENEHLKTRRDKWNAMSEKDRQKIMSTNMYISSGLEDSLKTLARETATEVAALGESAVPLLMKKLRSLPSEIHYQRWCIARSFRQIGRPAVPYLIEALQGPGPQDKDADARYRNIIISTLGEIEDPRAIAPLLGLLHKSRTSSIRYTSAIVTALGKIGDKRAAEPIISELDIRLVRATETDEWGEDNGWVMIACARALGLLEDKRAIPVLRKTLNAGPQTTKAGEEYLLADAAAQALRSLGIKVEGKNGNYQVIEIAPQIDKLTTNCTILEPPILLSLGFGALIPVKVCRHRRQQK